MNMMRRIRIEKITLNIGAGKDQNVLKKSVKLLKNITGIEPVKTITRKRIAAWGLRPGLPIGCKITLRKVQAKDILPRLLSARNNELADSNFDNFGNISFGIQEYIDIPGVKYDPEIGMAGLQVSITLERPGFRIKKRKICKKKIKSNHQVSKKDAMAYMKSEFKLNFGKEAEQ